MVFYTFEYELKYKMDYGQVGDIHITPLTPLPGEGDTTARILKTGLVIIRWNIRHESGGATGLPNWISLELFKPNESYSSSSSEIPFPPSGGDEIVRADEIGGKSPTKEDSKLWQNYISRYWEQVTPFYRLDTYYPDDYYKVDELYLSTKKDPLKKWPGPSGDNDLTRGRTVHHVKHDQYYTEVMTPLPIPLRVAESIDTPVDVTVRRRLLVLFMIKRKGRLRLKAWPFVFKIHRPYVRGPCFIAAITNGTLLEPQVASLRNIRDKNLRSTKLGSLSIDRIEWIYYKFSPHAVKTIRQYPLFKRIMRYLIVTPLIYILLGVFKPSNKFKTQFR